MKLVVGLGNPDKEYKNTFHNLGFMVIDAVADKVGFYVNKDSCKALVGSCFFGTEKVLFAKPQTYMNLSGESVLALASYYKIAPEDILVVYDDFDLKKGAIRIRANGSAGTHNGMRNIVKNLGTEDFKRIRIGFNPDNKNIVLLNYVLSGIPSEDKDLFKKVIDKVALAIEDFANGKDFEYVMRTYNGNVLP
ncbi:MAG: aminoacyl-tRNA hydrolase [Clostridia bacterium]|nr:aminoacyl-tRNA hydrolase [Clostridia bacterium]